MNKPIRAYSRFPFHYAWIIVILTFMTTLTGAGIRSAFTVLINPLENEFAWSRVALSSAVGLNLLMYGVGAPIAGRLLDRIGPRLVMLGSLALLAGGLTGTLFMKSFWQLVLFWGVVVGLGCSGVASVLSATVANRWFVARRGMFLGILNSAASTGQLIFLPLLMTVIVTAGWRNGLIIMVAVALALAFLVALWMRDEPGHIGLEPYGAKEGAAVTQAAGAVVSARFVLHNPTFWFLAGSFFICGATTAGLIGTHLIPHSIDHGIPEVMAATTVGVMGGMNFVGTLLSGWLTDRLDPRRILSFVFMLRGLSLLMLPFVHDFSRLLVFGVVYGLDSFATVPPVVTLTADTFGKRSVGSVFGWIFLAHQIGGSLAATGGGALRSWLGGYQLAFLLGGALALIGAGLALGIPRQGKVHPANS